MIRFEWDERKAQKNFLKHGVTFDIAANVFYDEHRLEFYDVRHSETEDRFYTIGRSDKILFVVYTERYSANGYEIVRLISARTANAEERKKYNDHLYFGR